jgi:hypothetical protein
VSGLSAYAKEAATILTTKSARDTAAWQRDPVGNLPFAPNTDDGILPERADPDTSLAIETDSVRLTNLTKAAAECEEAVGPDLKLRKTIAVTLSDDQGAMIRRYRNPVRKTKSRRGDTRDTVRGHHDQSSNRISGNALAQIESEIADEGSSLAVDDHVVDRSARDFRQVGVTRHLPIGVSEKRPLEHRRHDWLASRQKAQAGRDVRDSAHSPGDLQARRSGTV